MHDIHRAVDEITVLARSLRNQYNILDEIVDPLGAQTRPKSSVVTSDQGKKSKSHKGRKARIAPTAGQEDNGTRPDSADVGVEMVGVNGKIHDPADETEQLVIADRDNNNNGRISAVTENGGKRQATDTDLAELDLETNSIIEDDNASDTQALLGPSAPIGGNSTNNTRGAIDITGMVTAAPKRVIIADILRFFFLGIPG